ncbi:hypothetical protein NFI96_027929 [Prochilodus magdalenae]|nr:hypothetical protein NFI96_027929 [Prochilodus magdalenae]
MEVNSVNSSLTITAVQDSDSGLYYCSRLENKYMIYSTTTYLHIREKFPASSNEPDGDDRWSDGFFILALVGGAVMVVLLSVLLVLLFTVLKYRRQHREVTCCCISRMTAGAGWRHGELRRSTVPHPEKEEIRETCRSRRCSCWLFLCTAVVLYSELVIMNV